VANKPYVPDLVALIKLKKKWTRTQWTRLGVQLLFMILTAYGIIRHRINEAAGLAGPSNEAPSVDSLSPFGGLETLWTWVRTGTTLNHLHLSDLVLLVAVLVLALLLGASFCGWICPFGTIQEYLYKLRIRLVPYKISLPRKIDNILRYGRYVVLGLVLFATYGAGEFIFGAYCPWKAAWDIGSAEIAIGGLVVLGLVVVGGLLVERAWCRYACPLGAVLGIANKLTPVKLRRSETACTSCQLCSKKCPLEIEITAVTTVSDTTCNRCLECVDSCPKHEALALKLGWWERAKSFKGWAYGFAAAAVFGGVIGIAMMTGNWVSYAVAAPPKVTETGMVDPEEIKGWRPLQDIIGLWKIPQDILYREMELDPSTPPSTKVKDLEAHLTQAGVPTDRTFVVEVVKKWQRGELMK